MVIIEKRNDRRSSRFFLIFLAGGVVGAAIALIYAPLTGNETRRYLRIQKERARSKTWDLTDKLKKQVSEIIDDVKGSMDKMIEEGIEISKEKKSRLLAAIDEGKRAMEEEKKRIVQHQP